MAKTVIAAKKAAAKAKLKMSFDRQSEELEVIDLSAHPQSDKVAIATFADDSQALVSAKHFDEDGDPQFIDEQNMLTDEFEKRSIRGVPWIVTKTGGLTLPGERLPA